MRPPIPVLATLPFILAAAGCATTQGGSGHELVGYVMDHDRVPIANARVQVVDAAEAGTPAQAGAQEPAAKRREAVQISNLGGAFVVRELLGEGGSQPLQPERSYRVLVEEPDYRVWEGTIAFQGGLHEVEIELIPVLDQVEDSRPVDPDAVDPVMEGQIREGT